MPRLIDRILADGFVTPSWTWRPVSECERRDLHARFAAAAASAEIIVGDNVTEWMCAEGQPIEWRNDELPTVAPPYGRFWVETTMPSRVPTDERGWTTLYPLLARWGALFHALQPSEAGAAWCAARVAGTLKVPTQEVAWYLVAELFAEPRGERVHGQYGVWIMALDARGRVVSLPRIEVRSAAEEPAEVRAFTENHLAPLLLTVAFSHFRNVRQVEAEPPPKLSRAHAKRRGHPLVRYKTLLHDPALSLAEVADFAGHASGRVTMEVYGHVLPTRRGETAQGMERIMRDAEAAVRDRGRSGSPAG